MIAMLQTGGKRQQMGKGSMVSLIFSLRSSDVGYPYILSKRDLPRRVLFIVEKR